MEDTSNKCEQQRLRRLRMLFNVPLPRYNPISPYKGTSFSKFDLDMRRKAEILKHTGPQKSTQVNKLTKAQQYAQLVSGNSPTQKLLDPHTGQLKQIQQSFCDSSLNFTLTSSSDVPGPIVSLYLDKNIPLYNYAAPNSAFNENTYDIYNIIDGEFQ